MSKTNKLPDKKCIKLDINKHLSDYLNLDIWKKYRDQENCLELLFTKIYSNNNDLVQVLAKVACLNAYYSTNVLALNKMANHIINIENLENKLKNGNESLIDEMSNIPLIKNRRFYSFATKYCFRYNKEHFPIFDANVEYFLKIFIKEQKLNYKAKDLKNYTKFKEIIDIFRNYYELTYEEYSVRDLDHYMWMLGGELRGIKHAY